MRRNPRIAAQIGMLLAAATPLVAPSAQARTWWVDPSGAPAHFLTLEEALAVAVSGDTIRLARGTHSVSGMDPGYIPSGIAIIGEPDQPASVEVTAYGVDGAEWVVGIDTGGTLAGVTLLPQEAPDGGVACAAVVGRLLLSRCVGSPANGRGIYASFGALVAGVEISGDFRDQPLYFEGGEIRNSWIRDSTSQWMFGSAGGVMANCVIEGTKYLSEHVDGDPEPGWAMEIWPWSFGGDVYNNTFAANGVSGESGATILTDGGPYETTPFINNLVAFNRVSGIMVFDRDEWATTYIHHNNAYGNPNCNYCTYDYGPYETPLLGVVNYDVDPLFVAFTDDGDWTNDDLRLQAGSPLIDAGDPSILDADGSVSDVGAYGGPGADLDGDGLGPLSGDCDDGDPTVREFIQEQVNGLDDDCDGLVDEDTSASDDDGDGWTEDAGDCSDRLETIHPGAVGVMGNGWDDDCDGVVDAEGGGDDDTAPDDDSASDDDSSPDDDTAPPDDDTTPSDDDTSPDDDSTPPDDDAAADDDTSPADDDSAPTGGGEGGCGCASTPSSPQPTAPLIGLAALAATATRRRPRCLTGAGRRPQPRYPPWTTAPARCRSTLGVPASLAVSARSRRGLMHDPG